MNARDRSGKGVTIVLTLLVRDEADIIACNLDYHLGQGIDWIIVTDNGSTDGTREIVEECARRGRVALFHEPPSDFSQHRWVTQMARLAYANYRADWVINADADEFFVPRRGRLREQLAECRTAADVMFAARTDFVPFDRPFRDPPPIEMVYRKSVSLDLAGRPLPPKALHRGAPDVIIAQGNHDAHSSRFRPERPHAAIEVFHYPIRSRAQFERKVRNGGSGYAQNKDLDRGVGFHKRYWYELLQNGELDTEYQRRRFHEGQLAAALASGQLLEDRAVADWLIDARGTGSRSSGLIRNASTTWQL
jgi:glycosyltransferase involved in cell wall biosynthesis